MTLTNLTYEQQAMLMEAEKVRAERDRYREALLTIAQKVYAGDGTYGAADRAFEEVSMLARQVLADG